jgi:hypothetical protein
MKEHDDIEDSRDIIGVDLMPWITERALPEMMVGVRQSHGGLTPLISITKKHSYKIVLEMSRKRWS